MESSSSNGGIVPLARGEVYDFNIGDIFHSETFDVQVEREATSCLSKPFKRNNELNWICIGTNSSL